jgi:hypothetical protein
MLQGWEILFSSPWVLLRHHSSREPPAFHSSNSASEIIGAVLGLALSLRLGSSQQPTPRSCRAAPLCRPDRAVQLKTVLAKYHEERAAGIAATAAHQLRSTVPHSELSSPRPVVVVVVVVRIILVDKSASEQSCCQTIGRDGYRFLGRFPSHHLPRCGRLDLSGVRPGFVVETKATTAMVVIDIIISIIIGAAHDDGNRQRNEYYDDGSWRWSCVGT